MERPRLEHLLDEVLAMSLHTYLNQHGPPGVGYMMVAFSGDGSFRVIGNNPNKQAVIEMLRIVADSLDADVIGQTVGNA